MSDAADNPVTRDGAQAPSSSTPREPLRVLPAARIAALTGRKKRVVLKWAEEGCPHRVGMRRNQPALQFNLDEVRAWLVARGLDPTRADTRDQEEAPQTPSAPPPAHPPSAQGVSELLSARLDELKGEVDWDLTIARTKLAIEEILAQRPPENAEPGWGVRWSEAVGKASERLIKLDAARAEARERSRQLLRRDEVTEILVSQGRMFAEDLESLAADLTRSIVTALADVLASDVLEAARRVIQVQVREATDGVRTRRAAAIRAALEAA